LLALIKIYLNEHDGRCLYFSRKKTNNFTHFILERFYHKGQIILTIKKCVNTSLGKVNII